MIKWVKPNGNEVETNDLKASIEAAEALGWKRAEEAKKRGRPANPDKE